MYDINYLLETEKKALESTYFDKVTVYRNENQNVENITKLIRKQVLTNEPCALSKSSKISANIDNGINRIEGEHTLFLSKQIKKGDELVIKQADGREYTALAGEPNFFQSHYEVPVKIEERA